MKKGWGRIGAMGKITGGRRSRTEKRNVLSSLDPLKNQAPVF